MATNKSNTRMERKEAQQLAATKRKNAWRTARLALLLGLSLGLGAFAGSTWAADYEIDGTTGKTLADVVSKARPGDTITVLNNQTTAAAQLSGMFTASNDFTIRSAEGGSFYISGNDTNHIFTSNRYYGIKLTLDNITFQDGYRNSNGGAFNLGRAAELVGATDSGYTFTGNNADDYGGAIYAGNKLTLSGDNVTVKFTDNKITTGNTLYGHDITVLNDFLVTGTGTYTFADGVWAQGNFDTKKVGNGNLVLTTGDTNMGNSQKSSNDASKVEFLGVFSSSKASMTFDGVTLKDSNVNTGDRTDISEYDGIAFAMNGFHFNNTSVTDNSLTSNGNTNGIVFSGLGDASPWAETSLYSTLSGETTFSGNTLTSAGSANGGAIYSVQYLFLGAQEGETGAVDVNGSIISFEDNSANGAGANRVTGGAIATNRNVLLKSSDNAVTFSGNTAVAVDGIAYGGAIATASSYDYGNDTGEFGVDFSGANNDVSFLNNQALSANGTAFGGAIATYKAVETANMPIVQFGGDGSSYTFTGNIAKTRGGAIYSEGDVNFSGEDLVVEFTGNRVTDGFTNAAGTSTRKYGNDIFTNGAINIDGSGTYTFEGGTWAEGDFNVTGSSQNAITLTTGDTTQTNAKVGAYGFGVLSSNDKTSLTNVILQDSNLNTVNHPDVDHELSGILFGGYGVNLDNVTVMNNSITADTAIAGIVYSNTGNAKTWEEEVERYSTASGTTLFQGNTLSSITDYNPADPDNSGSTGGAVSSNTYFFVGATEGEDGPNQVGGSMVTFTNNEAGVTGTGEAEAGAFASARGLVMASDDNALSFTNNKATSSAGNAYGGAIGITTWYDYANSSDFGVLLLGDNNTVTFDGNEATGANGFGGAISLRGYDNTCVAPTLMMSGDNSTYLFQENNATTAGGAVYATGDVTIAADATFVNNTAGENGGAIFVDTNSDVAGRTNASPADPTYGADVSIIPDEGETVTFAGNTAGGEANSITFGDGVGETTHGDYVLNLSPNAGGTIDLLDPIKVNMVFSASNPDNKFTLNRAGDGLVNWAGTNSIKTDNGTSYVNFVSGTTNLANDFSLVNDGDDMIVNITGGDTGAQLGVDLNGRDNNLAMFANPTKFGVDGDPANVTINTLSKFSDDETQRWLVTDNRDTTDADSFNLISNRPTIDATMETEGDNLYIQVVNKADEIIANSTDPNARRAREGVENVWDETVDELEVLLPPEQVDDIYNEMVYNTEVYTAEGIVGQGFGAFDLTNQMANQVYEFNRLGDQFECNCVNDQIQDIPLRTWGGYVGSEGSLDTNGYHGFEQSWNGILAGVSRDGERGGTVGTWFGYADGRNRFDELNTRLENKAYNTGVFAIFRLNEDVSLASDFTYSHIDNEAWRFNNAGSYTGKMDQDTYGAGMTLRRDIVRDNRILSPVLGVRYQHLNQGDYDEVAQYGVANFTNSLDAFSADSMQSRVGATWTMGYETPQGRTVSPMFYAMWRHEFMDNDFSTTGYYTGAMDQPFMVASIARERDLADLGGTLSVTNNCTTVGVGYNATITENYRQHNWFAGMSYRF